MLRPLLVICLFLLMQLPLSAAGAAKARPQSGIGLLTIRADMNPARKTPPVLLLFKEPKLGRLGERSANQLPGLAPAMIPAQGEWHAVVTGSRLGWLRIIYDEAEREGWVDTSKSLDFRRWGEFLKGRRIALLPGLKKEFYALRNEASLSSASSKTVEKAGLLDVNKIAGDWVQVRAGSDLSGWLRWRDENGRLTILLNPKAD